MKSGMERYLLYSGLFIPPVFWISTFVAGSMHSDYSHVRDTVSQLGAIGSPSETVMTASTWLCTILSLTFLMGLVIICRRLDLNTAPLVGILGFAIMFGWAATFHSGNPLHAKAGPAAILLLLGPLLATILWKGNQFKTLRRFSALSFGIMLLILLRAIPSSTIQDNYTGLIQRFVHLGWSVWFVAVALTFLTVRGNRGA